MNESHQLLRDKFLAELWVKARKFKMKTFGKLELDKEVAKKFGPWLDQSNERVAVPWTIFVLIDI